MGPQSVASLHQGLDQIIVVLPAGLGQDSRVGPGNTARAVRQLQKLLQDFQRVPVHGSIHQTLKDLPRPRRLRLDVLRREPEQGLEFGPQGGPALDPGCEAGNEEVCILECYLVLL